MAETTEKYEPKDEEKKLRDLVVQRFKQAKDNFVTYRKGRLDKYYRSFRSDGSERLAKLAQVGGDDWMSNLFVPMTASHVRTIHPRAVDAKPQLKVEGRTSVDMKKSRYVQAILEYVWEKAGMESKMRDFVWQAIVMGTSIGKVLWKKDMMIKSDKVIDENDLTIKDVVENIEIYNDPNFEVVDIYNFYPDPYATCIEDARYVTQRYLLTKDQILSTYSGLENTKFIKGGMGDLQDYASVRRDVVKAPEKSSIASDSSLIEVCEYWERDRFILMAGDVILRQGKNPLRIGSLPYTVVCYEKLPFEFYGIGVCEQLEQPQKTLNVIRNQRIDNVTLGIQKQFIVNPYALISKKDLVARPGGIIRTSDVNGIVPVQTTPMGEAAFREDALALDAGRMATGIDDWSRGLQGPSSTTATAVSTQKESTLERIRLFVSSLESDVYAKIMRYWVAMGAELYPTKILDRLTDNGVDIEKQTSVVDRPLMIRSSEKGNIRTYVSKDDLLGNYDYKALSISTLAATKELGLKRIIDIMNLAITAGVDPVTKEMIPNLRELWTMLFLFSDKEPSQMLNPEKSQIVPPEIPGGGPAPTGTGREVLNNALQKLGMKAPMGAEAPRTSPLPDQGQILAKAAGGQ